MVMAGYDRNAMFTDSCEYRDQKFFGLVRMDIQPNVDENFVHMQRLRKFPPLFIKGRLDGDKAPSLRGILSAEKTLISTPYLQCLYILSYKVTKVHVAYEYMPGKVLKSFVEMAVEAHKRGDLPGGNPLMLTHTNC